MKYFSRWYTARYSAMASNYERVMPSRQAVYRALFRYNPSDHDHDPGECLAMEAEDLIEVSRPVELERGTEEHPEG